jgi:hypothetical protein|tara:strand:- start:214 stop:1113 length:900 start_codon:yes stop_codon:yes gene_type:complete
MKLSINIGIGFLLSFLIATPVLKAQEETGNEAVKNERYVCLTLVNQMVRCGYLIEDDGREIKLNTSEMGLVIIPKADVISMVDAAEGTLSQSMNPVSARASQSILDPNRSPQSSRYFFAPSAFPMKLKEGYAHVNPLSGNVTRQVSDNFMVGGALSWVGFGATIKASARLGDNLYGSVGGMALLGFYGNGPTFFPYINLTSGDHNSHFSVALAALTFDGEVSPMINFSACKEVNPRLWLITENYYFTDPMLFSEQVLLSFGARWWSSSKNSLGEFALMLMITEDGDAIPIPWFGRTWPF